MSAPGAPAGEPTEEELRAAYEAELSRLTTTDMIAQAVVSLLNIGARRLAPPGGDRDPARPGDDRGPTRPSQRDLEQARDAIDAVRALLEILERSIPQEIKPLRDALSRLQMAYAREAAPRRRGAAGRPGRRPWRPGRHGRRPWRARGRRSRAHQPGGGGAPAGSRAGGGER